MTRSDQVWSCQRRDRSRSVKDKSRLVRSSQVQITSSLVRTWSGQSQVRPAQVRPDKVKTSQVRSGYVTPKSSLIMSRQVNLGQVMVRRLIQVMSGQVM